MRPSSIRRTCPSLRFLSSVNMVGEASTLKDLGIWHFVAPVYAEDAPQAAEVEAVQLPLMFAYVVHALLPYRSLLIIHALYTAIFVVTVSFGLFQTRDGVGSTYEAKLECPLQGTCKGRVIWRTNSCLSSKYPLSTLVMDPKERQSRYGLAPTVSQKLP